MFIYHYTKTLPLHRCLIFSKQFWIIDKWSYTTVKQTNEAQYCLWLSCRTELQFHENKNLRYTATSLDCTVGTSCSYMCSSPVIKMLGRGSRTAYNLFYQVSTKCKMNTKNMNIFLQEAMTGMYFKLLKLNLTITFVSNLVRNTLILHLVLYPMNTFQLEKKILFTADFVIFIDRPTTAEFYTY